MKFSPAQALTGLTKYDISLQIDLPALAYYGQADIAYTNNTGA